MSKNPFRQLYVGESVGPEEFVKLFSPILVEYSLALFQSGNLVIKGFTGAGKSMLLNLLDPSIRIAYNKLNVKFPIPDDYSKFIGAGINLQTSGVSHFGNRPIDGDYKTTPIYFGDYLNYYVVSDMLESLQQIIEFDKVAAEIGIQGSLDKLNDFARSLAKDECWFGFLDEVNDYQSLKTQLRNRIKTYKAYLNFNIEELPEVFLKSKSIIGEPISKTANLLKKFGIVNNNVQFFIRIDQYEELAWLGATDNLGKNYQDIIHTLLGSRDSSVSYRIGTRRFAWTEEKTMYGTTAPLEKKRNYLELVLDDEMRRKENSRDWVFPILAEDIFRRRLLANNFKVPKSIKNLIKKVFGPSTSPKDLAAYYYPSQRKRAVDLENTWPEDWKQFLLNVAADDPLNARFGEAWARQKGKESIIYQIPQVKPYPWERKVYWKKERTEQALIQLASRNNQQLMWAGKDDIIALSGGNILTLLSICQHVWDVWLRDSREIKRKETVVPSFDKIVQSVGVIEASTDWFNELAIDERGGKNRKKLIYFLGVHFFKTLINDKAMSNPGHNGFSLDLEQIDSHPFIAQFLGDCTDYGDLYDSPHTSKLPDKKKRRKYYLNPILSPFFKIPYVHTKEPIYISPSKFLEWLEEANINLSNQISSETFKRKRKNIKPNNNNLSFNF